VIRCSPVSRDNRSMFSRRQLLSYLQPIDSVSSRRPHLNHQLTQFKYINKMFLCLCLSKPKLLRCQITPNKLINDLWYKSSHAIFTLLRLLLAMINFTETVAVTECANYVSAVRGLRPFTFPFLPASLFLLTSPFHVL